MGIGLQLAMVVGGHFSEAILNLSGILGTGIPFVLGIWYGATVPRSYKETAGGGFVIGIVGAVIGVLAAILMGDQPWLLLTFAPLSSGITGVLGGLIGTAATGRAKTVQA
jgi:hypothetical protein